MLRCWLTPLYILMNYSAKNQIPLMVTLSVILIVLIFAFFSESLLTYFFFFEVILIPTYALILGWGYQPERITAATIIIFYTIAASLPLLARIISLSTTIGSTDINSLQLGGAEITLIISTLMLAAFLVKFPIYLSHLWLPKAHVEAPVSGSIVLAGVLLKLGGYGIIISTLIGQINPTVSIMVISVAIVGGGLLRVSILRMSDLKVAIAYSSVVHISIVITRLLTPMLSGVVGAVWIMLAHGLTSSGMFGGGNLLYTRTHTRSLISNKGILATIPTISSLWFVLIVLNFAGPFTINLFSEIHLVTAALSVSLALAVRAGIMCFFSAAYNLNLYASSQQGKQIELTTLKSPMSRREIMGLFAHIWPCVIVLVSIPILSGNSTENINFVNLKCFIAHPNIKI